MYILTRTQKTASFFTGAALSHLAANTAFKLLSKTHLGHKLESHLLQSGVNHAVKGKTLHPLASSILQGGVGPELMAPYELGQTLGKSMSGLSTGNRRKAFKKMLWHSQKAPNTMRAPMADSLPLALKDMVARKQSPLSKLPAVAFGTKATLRDKVISGGLAAGATYLAPDASAHIALNAGRRAIANSKFGKKFMQDQFIAAAAGKPQNKYLNLAQQLVVSPGSTYPAQLGEAMHRDAKTISPDTINNAHRWLNSFLLKK